MSDYINWNGKLVSKSDFYVSPDNRSFRYGDGFFETMKVNELSICLEDLHFERLFLSLDILQFEVPNFFTPLYFREQVQLLLRHNNHLSLARVRLMIYRGNGSVYDLENNYPNFIIQSWSLREEINELNKEGLRIDIFRDARKTCDKFSLVKSNNYLCYLMAAFYATKNKLNDVLILNPYDRIAESTIANVFIVHNDIVKTPALTEGCVNGVYRKFLIQSFSKDKIPFIEQPLSEADLASASEVFLTNAVQGIKWVYKCGGVAGYTNEVAAYLHDKYKLL